MLKLNQICKLNEDTMASYESQLMKKKEKEKNLHGTIRLSRCAAGKKVFFPVKNRNRNIYREGMMMQTMAK